MGKIVGIDAGTGNSVISIYENGKVTVIPNSEGALTTPSVVSFDDNGRMVGRVAKSQAAINPTRTIASVKRFIGRFRNEVTEEEKIVPYKIVGEPNEPVQIDIDGRRIFPQEISAAILADLKKSAEAYLGERVTAAVISTPAYFSSAQREATAEAGRIAGFDVKRILSEPTAAALAYGIGKNEKQKIAVFDIGMGTYDISVIETADQVFEVLAVNGDGHLGGENWDMMLVDYVSEEFKTANGVDIRSDPMALQRLVDACEKLKCDLSATTQATLNLPYITAVNGVPKHLSTTITRAKFDSICAPLFERLRGPCLQALQDAKLLPSQIDHVILVGGATRMNRAQEICKEIFGKEPNKSVNPDLCVSMGCAIQGSVLSGDITDIILLDVTPLSLGVEVQGGLFHTLVPRNTTIPMSKSETFSTASDNQPAVDIHVLQGERKMANGNRTLGRFQMTGIPLQARGKPAIEVNFDLDANGILNVSAKDKNTGKECKVEIKGSSGLEKSDIERMVKDAAAYEAEDKGKAELIEIRNKVDNLVYETDKFMRENAKFISAPIHSSVKQCLDAAKSVFDSNGPKDQLVTAISNLEAANKKMYDECFAASEKAGQVSGTPPPPPAAKPSVTGMPTGDVFNIE